MAITRVILYKIGAISIADTRLAFAIVDVVLAQLAEETGIAAAAFESIDKIGTLSTILARNRFAFVYVDFTLASCESKDACAVVGVDKIGASRSILARLRLALIDVNFAVATNVARRADATVTETKMKQTLTTYKKVHVLQQMKTEKDARTTYLLTWFSQVAPFWQGAERHSLTSMTQLMPE